MCFADINNIYLHDGRQASPIGQTILNEKAEQTGWLFKNTSTDPLVFFEGSTKSFVIYFQKQAGNGAADHLAWAYNVLRRRWDLWYGPTAGAVGGIVGKNGEMLINDGTNLRHMKGDSNYANWEFRTKNITLGASTQEKMFYKIRTVGDTGCEIAYSVDGGSYTNDVTSTNSVDISANNKKKKALKIRLKGTGSEIIDSVGVVYRRLKVK